MPKHLVCISGAYRAGGITEQALDVIAARAAQLGWTCERIRLIEKNIKYCTNCRQCLQSTGVERGACPIQDDVAGILASVDRCDAVVLAAPTNFYDVTAVTRVFLERTISCGFWPWGKMSPVWRRQDTVRPALLLTSTAMPSLMARLFTYSMKSLGHLAKCLLAKPVCKLYLGMVARKQGEALSDKNMQRLQRAAEKLLGA